MKYHFLSFAVLALGLAACSQDDLQLETPETPVTEISREAVEPGSRKVSLNLAEKVALSTRPGTRAGTDIQDIRTVFTDDGEPAFHAVNFTNSNGFVLVSASKNYTPILAKVDNGSFDLINLPPNVREYLESYKSEIQKFNKAPEDSVKIFRRQWQLCLDQEPKPVTRKTRTTDSSTELDAFIFDSQMQWSRQGYKWTSLAQDELGLDFFWDVVNGLEDHAPELDPATVFIVLKPVPILESIDKLLTTEWGQGKPYNALIPNGDPVGCNALAVGQVMKYHKKPANFNWDAMKDVYYFYENAPEVATLLADAYVKTKSRRFINSNNIIETVSNLGLDFNALKEYGYKNMNLINYDFYTIAKNIEDKMPVIGCGFPTAGGEIGHTYIYDGLYRVWNNCMYFLFVPREAPNASGYFKYRWEETDLEKGIVETYTTDNKFHINWGYNGMYNGLYHQMVFKDEDGIEHNYDYNKSVIVNIK